MAAPVDVAAPAARTAAPRLFYGWYIVGGAAAAQFAAMAAQVYVTGVFLVPMTSELGWSRSEYTLALTVGQFTTGAIGFWIGTHVDRHGGRRLMLVGAVLGALTLLLLSQVHELWQWLLLRGVLVAIGTSLYGNLVVNVIVAKWFVERRGRAIGFAGVGLSGAGIVAPPVITAIVDAFGWRAAWQVLAVATLLIVIPVALIMRRQPEDHGLHPDGKSAEQVLAGAAARAEADFANSLRRSEALRTTAFYLVVFAYGIAGFSIFALVLQSIPFLTDAGYSRATASFLLAVFAFPSTFSKPVWGYLAERIHPRHLSTVCFVLTALGMVGILLGARAHSMPVLFAGFFTCGIGAGGQFPLSEFIWATYFGRRYLGEVRSAAMPLSLLFSAVGPIGVALYFDRVGDYNGAFIAMAVLWLVSATLVQFVRAPAPPARTIAALR